MTGKIIHRAAYMQIVGAVGRTAGSLHISSSIRTLRRRLMRQPTVYRRFRNRTESAFARGLTTEGFRRITAGEEFHLALKTVPFMNSIARKAAFVKKK